MKNAFDLDICEIKNLFNDDHVEACIRKTFFSVFNHLGIPQNDAYEIIDKCLELVQNYKNLGDYEKEAHKILEETGVASAVPKRLTDRAEIIYKQIKPYIKEGNILDHGCGDGRVGELLTQDGHKVILSDIYKNKNIDNLDLDFILFADHDPLPFKDNEFDNSLCLTVFHHSDDPLNVLKEMYRVTKSGGALLVIESVYGVQGEELSEEAQSKCKCYLELTDEQQRMTNIFFDHFYNRVIHYSDIQADKVNVPFNFNTPEGWKQLFETNGFEEEKVVHLGVDQGAVPEYHTLHVLKVIK